MKKNGGFTIIELIISITLTGVLLVGINSLFFQYTDYKNALQQKVELEQNLALAINSMKQDIQDCYQFAGFDADILLSSYLGIKNYEYTKNTSNKTYLTVKTVQYSLAMDPLLHEHPFGLSGKVLYRQEGTSTRRPIANYISSMQFEYYDQWGEKTTVASQATTVKITLTALYQEELIEKIAWISIGRYQL